MIPTSALADAYNSGLSLRQVGRRFGVSSVAVHFRLKKAGVARRPQGLPRRSVYALVYMRAQGMMIAEIAAQHGDGVRGILYRAGVTKERAAELLTLTPSQLDAYRIALDEDRLTHTDALDVAREYA